MGVYHFPYHSRGLEDAIEFATENKTDIFTIGLNVLGFPTSKLVYSHPNLY